MGWGVPETTGVGGLQRHWHHSTFAYSTCREHPSCLPLGLESVSFFYIFPPAGFFTADKGKRLMKEVTFHSPYLLIASLCCWAAPDRNTMQTTSHFKDTRQSPRLWSKDHRGLHVVFTGPLCIDNVRCERKIGRGGLRVCQNKNLNNVFEWTLLLAGVPLSQVNFLIVLKIVLVLFGRKLTG